MGLSISSVKARAEALFKKEGRLRQGQKAMTEYETERQAVQEKVARLRALRLARAQPCRGGPGLLRNGQCDHNRRLRAVNECEGVWTCAKM